MEGYIGKPNSDPHIVMVSTPKAPGGLIQQIELEPEDTCLYHRLFFDYHYGLQGPILFIHKNRSTKLNDLQSLDVSLNFSILG